jgi:hypothetical protein
MSSIDEDKTLLISNAGQVQKPGSQTSESIFEAGQAVQNDIPPVLSSDKKTDLDTAAHAQEFISMLPEEVSQTEADAAQSDLSNSVATFENEATQLEINLSATTGFRSSVQASIANDKTELSHVSLLPNQPPTMAEAQYQNIENKVSEVQSVQLAIGDVLNKRFKLVESLGKGGMGMVFKALD